ncbi:MAG: xanthine dehydrogenase family protein subunit M [Phycisphaerales bacterium]|nr:MAG: xanthine dehydrogenase family protein subunit M [Phycisphaerales bacterium]
MPDVELHECRSLEEAAALLTRYAPDVRMLAGGTDLLVDLKAGRATAAHLVSLTRVPALRGVTLADGALRVGALTTIAELIAAPVIAERWSPLLDAARHMASPQIRNMATVGGNIASGVPCADLPPILIVMGASVVLWSPDGPRTVPLHSFFTGPRQTARRSDELLVAVLVPEPARGSGAAYARFALREGNGIAVAAVAAGLRMKAGDVIDEARIVLGAVAPIPKQVASATEILAGKSADDADAIDAACDAAMRAAEPISDIRGSAEYRRELVGVLTRWALSAAAERAGGYAPAGSTGGSE